eukprot:3738890-Amphidinium_carterae.1
MLSNRFREVFLVILLLDIVLTLTSFKLRKSLSVLQEHANTDELHSDTPSNRNFSSEACWSTMKTCKLPAQGSSMLHNSTA